MTPGISEQIRRTIEARILSGEWAPGTRVPGDDELAGQYGCARMTANKALSALAAAGLVERRRRAGTFVARPRSQAMVLEITDLAAEVAARGEAYRWQLTRRRALRSEALGPVAPLLEIEGVHWADGAPFAAEQRLVNLAEVPAIAQADLTREAPGTWLLAHAPWTEAEHRISAEAADRPLAKALACPPGSACLTVRRRTWRGLAPVTLVTQHFAPGSHELIARFGARG
ncbi:UTRA domain-containing protein [Novosphingobium sp.]|uniref:UTRA domain-containing protein n=1 Tax=Novosphingobium sp. TaxID=1874826 RepID=UPI00286AFE67|nr:UTRA domain-containing protein [Novosphingobium sp.]